MGDIRERTINESLNNSEYSNSTAWNYRRLNEILIPGCHDAGLWTIVGKSLLANLVSDDYFITQSGSLLYQLCSGSRWFDMRINNAYENEWHVYHGDSFLSAYGSTLSDVITMLRTFLDDPQNIYEIVFWRIKTTNDDGSELSQLLRDGLKEYMLDYEGDNTTLQTLTLDQIWSNGNQSRGHVVVMSYGWVPTAVEPGKGEGWIWSYDDSQTGVYSDAKFMNGMLTKCDNGQQYKLIVYKSEYNLSTSPVIGIWWTFTTGRIRANTLTQWSNYPNGFNDFYTRNDGEIGNVIISDFFGDYPIIMEIVYQYNILKYSSFPPLSPTKNYTILNNPELPGADMLTSGLSNCDSSGDDNATEKQTRKVIGGLVGVLLGIILCIVGCVICCCCFCKHKETPHSYHA